MTLRGICGWSGLRASGVPRADHRDRAAVFLQLDEPADQPDRALVGIAFLEEDAAGRHRSYAHLLGERGEVVALETVERREGLQQLNAGFAFFGHVWFPACSVSST